MLAQKKSKASIFNVPFHSHDGNAAFLKVESLFQPDILTVSQYQDTHRRRFHLEPERVLMLAILEDAVVCFQENLGAASKRKQTLYHDAEEWMLDKDRSYFFSFENICDVLGFDAGYLRQGLLRWKEAALERRSGEPGCKRLAV